MSFLVSIPLSSYDKAAVLQAIKANPTWRTVDQLCDAFAELANVKPCDVDKFASVLADLKNDPEVPLIETTDGYGQPVHEPFRAILTRVVFDLLNTVFSYVFPSIEPTNEFLISALLSGASIRTGLCNSAVQSGMITLGLRYEESDSKELIPDEEAEIWVVHAALHLLAGGTRIYREQQIGYRPHLLLPALKAIAERNIVTNPQGKALLQVAIAAIAEAEAGFQTNLAIVDIWKILFP